MFAKYARVQKALALAAVAVLFGYTATVASAGFFNTQKQTELEIDDLFALQTAQGAAVDYFLKIDGIEGESKHRGYEKQIEIQSYSFGLTQSGSFAAGGGAGAGKVQVSEFIITKVTDKSSPLLMQACANGKHLKEATLFAVKSDESRTEFLEIKFTDLLITSYQTSAGGDIPTESMSFNFAKMDIEYRPQNADGSLGTPVRASFDFAKSAFQ
jgi:type VI secretion system secreted protein Hcp